MKLLDQAQPNDVETITSEIKTAMARAFFASAYADLCEENGEPLRGEIMDQLPDPVDPGAIEAANRLISGLERLNAPGITESKPGFVLLLIYNEVKRVSEQHDEGDRERTPENFGHYVAMQSMGHGVGVYDAFGRKAYDWLKVPYIDFSQFDLVADYGI